MHLQPLTNRVNLLQSLEYVQPQSRSIIIDEIHKHFYYPLIVVSLLLIMERINEHIKYIYYRTEHVFRCRQILIVQQRDKQRYDLS
jgi:hypothetical protein